MARYTPELTASVGHDYQNTDKSVPRIAADHGISARGVHRMRDREGWARRSERVRKLPPAMRALQEATTLLAGRAAVPARGESGDDGASNSGSSAATPPTPNPSPPFATLTGGGEPAPGPSDIERIERLVQRELAAEEAARANLGRMPRVPADAERCARTLATLTQTLNALARLRAGLEPDRGLPDRGLADDDMPRDIDEFRHELARRIRAFVQSRTGGELCAGVRPADAGGGEP